MYTIDLFEKWTDNFKRSIDCTNPKGFSQKAHFKGKSKTNEGQDNLDLMQGFRELLPVACKHLKIKKLPTIHLTKQQNEGKQPSFGGYDPNTQEISIGISNRHPVDVLRTLAHELVHYKQDCDNKLEANSHETGSPAENEANSEAGIIMRLFNKKCPQFMSVKPIQESQAKCPPATQDIAINTDNRNSTIKNYMYGPLNFKNPADYWKKAAKLWDTTEESAKESLCGNCVAFDVSPRMEECMPGKTSDDYGDLGYCWMHHFKCHSARTCETWAAGGPITDDKISLDWGKRANMNENFADGKVKGKSKPGRFKKAGVSCKGSVTDLRAKAKKASGERQKGLHFCANMKSGKK